MRSFSPALSVAITIKFAAAAFVASFAVEDQVIDEGVSRHVVVDVDDLTI